MPCNESTVTVTSRILPEDVTFAPSPVVLISSILLLLSSPFVGDRFFNLPLPAFAPPPEELVVVVEMVSFADEVGVAGVAVEDRG